MAIIRVEITGQYKELNLHQYRFYKSESICGILLTAKDNQLSLCKIAGECLEQIASYIGAPSIELCVHSLSNPNELDILFILINEQ